MPKQLLAAGLLVKTEIVPLSGLTQLREYTLLRSNVSNDFYPFNVPQAEHVDKLVPRLFVYNGLTWVFLDFAYLPRADVFDAPNLSRDNDHIVYMRPDVTVGEGQYPRFHDPNLRSYRVAIYHRQTRERVLLDGFTEVYGVGSSSFWRPDAQQLAFTTTGCIEGQPQCRQLVVLNCAGQTVLDGNRFAQLKGLEFMSWSPDGKRVAALRPTKPNIFGQGGGRVEVLDLANLSVKFAGEIDGPLAAQYAGRLDEAIRWDGEECVIRR